MNNVVCLEGNIGYKKEPKIYNRKDDTTGIVAKFPLGVYLAKDKTMWIDVILYDRLADEFHTNAEKGYKANVIGRLSFYKYKGTEGKDHKCFEVVADHVQYRKPKTQTQQ